MQAVESGLWSYLRALSVEYQRALSVELGGHVSSLCETLKKIKSFEALQTQPSPLPSEKAASTRNASTTISNK